MQAEDKINKLYKKALINVLNDQLSNFQTLLAESIDFATIIEMFKC